MLPPPRATPRPHGGVPGILVKAWREELGGGGCWGVPKVLGGTGKAGWGQRGAQTIGFNGGGDNSLNPPAWRNPTGIKGGELIRENKVKGGGSSLSPSLGS